MISAVSGTTTIAYDAGGRETSLTDPDGNKTQWAYDADDQVTTLTLPNAATLTGTRRLASGLTIVIWRRSRS
jgi:YD repeat-containing protein